MNRLQGKDLINIGIFTAIYFIVIFAAASIGFIPIFIPLISVIVPLVGGIPMMLFFSKIKKFGMLTITGIIGGIFFYLIGYGWIGLLGWVLGGILSDVVLKIGGYQKFKVTVLSYACFCLGIMGCPANLWFAGEA